jgi:cytochrome b
MDEAGLDALETPHAIIGLTAVSFWIVQACLGWLLWSDKEKARKIHRYNGYFVLSLAMLQVPVGILIFLEFRKYYP